MPALPPITIFDLETTGLDPRRGHRIIEIAGVRIENGRILEEDAFVSLVNPEREIPWEAKQVHKIDENDVKDAPTIEAVLPKFLSFVEGSLLMAHNASFDMGFLETEKQFCWGYVELPSCFCTMQLFRSVFPQEFRSNLDVVCSKLGIMRRQDRHRALGDVLLTAQALLKLVEAANIQSAEELKRRAAIGSFVGRN